MKLGIDVSLRFCHDGTLGTAAINPRYAIAGILHQMFSVDCVERVYARGRCSFLAWKFTGWVGSGRVGSGHPIRSLPDAWHFEDFLTRPDPTRLDPRDVHFLLLTRSADRVINLRTALFLFATGIHCTHFPRGGRCGHRAVGHPRRGSLARSRKFLQAGHGQYPLVWSGQTRV